MSAAFVGERKTKSPLGSGALLGIQTLVNYDPTLVKIYRSKDVGTAFGCARDAEPFVGIVELKAKFEMFLDNIFNGYRRGDGDISRLSIFRQQLQ